MASNTVEVHIHHLRHKLTPALIHTVRGVGYLVAQCVWLDSPPALGEPRQHAEALVGCAAGVGVYYNALQAANTIFDYHLKQVAFPCAIMPLRPWPG